jgi:hypothetical protein
MQETAYLIVLKGDYLFKEYEGLMSDQKQQFIKYIGKFHEYFPSSIKVKYKGISRMPLSPIPQKLSSAYGKIAETEAQFYFDEITRKYQDNEDYYDDSFLSIDDCFQVFSKVRAKVQYEIIKIDKEQNSEDKNIYGFDIGYWGGDHFSIIADTFLYPMWHPAPENDFQELTKYYQLLNQYCLFNSYDEAKAYREYYLQKDWAEKESVPNEICIQRIGVVLSAKNGA